MLKRNFNIILHSTGTGIAHSLQGLGYGLDNCDFIPRSGTEIFLFATACRPALWPTQPPMQLVPGALFRE
jgi:hypothetical protein